MIRQERIRTVKGLGTRVVFELPEHTWAESIHLVGDFNGWDPTSHPFSRDRDGRWWIAVELSGRRPHRFRYLLDGHDWLTDGQAEGWPATGTVTDFIVQAYPEPRSTVLPLPNGAVAGPLPVPRRALTVSATA